MLALGAHLGAAQDLAARPPSRIATVRLTCSATRWSWVTTTMVVPFVSFTVFSTSKISDDVAVSNSPVGSSANNDAGLVGHGCGDRHSSAAHRRRADRACGEH